MSPTRGGRIAAKTALAAVDPQRYERTRNFLEGAVTHLSAYLRHGVLTLAEVRDDVLRRVKDPAQAGKLINEFAWRDYWQRLYLQLGEGIWQDREPYKTGFRAQVYGSELPEDLSSASTTLVCMDSFSQQLVSTGYLHNHARMWTAAYLVHWRQIRWQAGARWFLEHLVDGDPASNNLSWQWVASSFASKPYFFNRENLERYTDGTYCKRCPHAKAGTCPFDRSYEALEQKLFPRLHSPANASEMPAPPPPFVRDKHGCGRADVGKPSAKMPGVPLLWVHTDSLNPDSPMLRAHPESPAVFVWNMDWLTKSQISLKRIVFLAECLAEMPGSIELRAGDPATELLAAAKASGATHILAQRTPDPHLRAAALAVERYLPMVWYDPPSFVSDNRPFELKRFSKYWQKAQHSALQPTQPGQ